MAEKKEKKKLNMSQVWSDARDIIWAHRHKVGLGFGLLIINRVCVFILPYSLKRFVDGIDSARGGEILTQLAFLVIGATLVQSLTGFSLSQLLSVTGQRAITDMRKRVARHVMRLPTQDFDRTKSGVLVSRIMNDAEGLRNLVGTGLVQMIGGVLTASVA